MIRPSRWVAEFSASSNSHSCSIFVPAVLPFLRTDRGAARNGPFRERDVAKPAASDYFVRLLRAALVPPRRLGGVGVQIAETDSPPDTVQRLIVLSHSTNFLRSLRLMPARTVCFGSPCRTATLSALLWLAVAPWAIAQNAPASAPADARAPDVAGDTGAGGLPAGLIQTHETAPELNIHNELYTDGDETKFKKDFEKPFQEALKSSTLTDNDKKAIDAGAKYWVYRFTMKKYYEEETPQKANKLATTKNAPPKERLHNLRKNLIDVVRNNAKITPAAREYFLKQVTKLSEDLLDNNLVVRQNILLLLGQLPLDNGNIAKGIEPAPYVPAYTVLLKVIKDEKQHEAAKISALTGLLRICKLGLAAADPANDKKRAEIAMALVPELAKKDTHWWYQFRLAECLGATGVTFDPGNKNNPIVLQTLADVVADKSRHWQARCEAARAIGRLPLDNTLNMTPVLFEIVKLGNDMAQAYNANPKKDSWANYFFTLYLAFKAENSKPETHIAGGKRKPGLLEALPPKEVKDVYEQVLQMVSHLVDNPGKQYSAEQLEGIDTWLKNHTPTNKRITASSPEIGSKPVPVPKPMPANGKASTPPTAPVAEK